MLRRMRQSNWNSIDQHTAGHCALHKIDIGVCLPVAYEYGSGYQVVRSTGFYGQYTKAHGQTGQINSFTTESGNTSKMSAQDQDLSVVSPTKNQEQPAPGAQAATDPNSPSYFHLLYGYQSNDQAAANAFGYPPVDLKHSTPMYTPSQATIYMQSRQANSTQTTTSDECGPGATPPPSASVTPKPAATVAPKPGPKPV